MKSLTYQHHLKQHLAEYRRNSLGIADPGTFKYRGVDLSREHILPADAWRRNLLALARPAAERFLEENPTRRHRYFHHLNSSQAFTFNLFFPYFEGGANAASSLLRAFNRDSVLVDWEPERIPDGDARTNIDVWWQTDDGEQTFCEVKLSEIVFGKARLDAEHRDKIRIYTDRLQHHVEQTLLEPCAFVEAYQFLRNVWHLVGNKASRLIFLLPRANRRPWQTLEGLLSKVAPLTRERIRVVGVEDVLAQLSSDALSSAQLRAHAGELTAKYIPRIVT